jgi:F-type H+-transporting ATPase subunit b
MEINWLTVAFQILNFLIVIAVLKYFAFDKIMKAIKERQKTISSRFEDAKQKREEAEKEAESYRGKKQELESKQQSMLDQAKADADKHRKELIEKARAETDDLRVKWQDSVKREKGAFLSGLQRRIGSEVYAIARKALSDLATEDLEKQMVKSFIDKLEQLGDEDIKMIEESSNSRGGKLMVRSAFDLPEDARRELEGTLRGRIPGGKEIEYMTSADVISGIELNADGHKVAWSLGDYLNDLEEEMTREIDRMTAPKPKEKSAPKKPEASAEKQPEEKNEPKREQDKKSEQVRENG